MRRKPKKKSYHTYKYSYDSIGVPSIDYDDDPNRIMKWKDSGETGVLKKPRDLKPLADQLHQIGAEPLLKYFLDGSRHVFKVDDIAYNKQVFPVVAGQIGVGCCRRDDKRMHKERFYRELVLALPDKANADGWDDTAFFASKVKKLNESEKLQRLGLHFLKYCHIQLQKREISWITGRSSTYIGISGKTDIWKLISVFL